MKKTTSPETQTGGRHLESVGITDADAPEAAADPHTLRRAALRNRHAQGLSRLMEHRSDLRGVNRLADFVDDSIRWTA